MDNPASLKKTFEEQSKKIEDTAMTAMLKWPEQYVAALKAVQKRLQSSGNLEGWKAAQDELTRFNQDRQLREEHFVADPADLRAIQEKYAAVPGEVEANERSRLGVLTRKYADRLTALQKKLTIAGKMDDALAVRQEIARITPQLEELADTGGQAPKAAEKPPARQQEAERPPSAAPPLATLPKVPMPAGAKLYDSLTAPAVEHFTFKTLKLSGTDRIKMSRHISATAALGQKAEVTRSVSGYYYRYEQKAVAVDYILRVGLRPGNTDVDVGNAVLVAEYFGKKVGRTAGKVTPRRIHLQVVPLPKIDATHSVTVDCPRTSTYGESAQRRSYYYGRDSIYDRGEELYGVVISVFAEDGKLIFQAASNNTLEKTGLAEFPLDYAQEERQREMEQTRTPVGVMPVPVAPTPAN